MIERRLQEGSQSSLWIWTWGGAKKKYTFFGKNNVPMDTDELFEEAESPYDTNNQLRRLGHGRLGHGGGFAGSSGFALWHSLIGYTASLHSV